MLTNEQQREFSYNEDPCEKKGNFQGKCKFCGRLIPAGIYDPITACNCQPVLFIPSSSIHIFRFF